MRIPGQGLGAWLTGPQRPPELVFPQTTRSRVLREIKDDMSLRVKSDPLKLQWLVKKLHDAFGHATDEEAKAAREQPQLAKAKDALWSAVADAMAVIKTTNGRPTILFEFIMNCREARERSSNRFAACYEKGKLGLPGLRCSRAQH